MNNALDTKLTPPNPDEPPEWLRDFTDTCVEAFGLDKWDLYLIMQDRLENENGDILDGRADSNPVYMSANVLFPSNIKETTYSYCTAVHEFLHVALAHQDLAIERIIELVPEELQDHANKLWQQANEHDVEMLSRSLAVTLRRVAGEVTSEEVDADGGGGCPSCRSDAEVQVSQPPVQVGADGSSHVCLCGRCCDGSGSHID